MPVPVQPLVIPLKYIKSSVSIRFLFRSFRRRHILCGSKQPLSPVFQIGAPVFRFAVSSAEIEESIQALFLRNTQHLHLKGLYKTLHRNIIVRIHVPAVYQLCGKIFNLVGPDVCGGRRHCPLRREYNGKTHDHGQRHHSHPMQKMLPFFPERECFSWKERHRNHHSRRHKHRQIPGSGERNQKIHRRQSKHRKFLISARKTGPSPVGVHKFDQSRAHHQSQIHGRNRHRVEMERIAVIPKIHIRPV